MMVYPCCAHILFLHYPYQQHISAMNINDVIDGRWHNCFKGMFNSCVVVVVVALFGDSSNVFFTPFAILHK